MTMVVYSFSSVWLYEQCPKKYQYKKIDNIETEFKSSPDLILWTSVHAALEWLYQQINIFKVPNKDDIINKFHEERKKWIENAGEQLTYKWEDKAKDYLRRWDFYLNRYYDKYSPFKWIKIIWTEMKLYFTLNGEENCDENKKSFFWIIDRLDKEDDGTFIINDYKTNKNLPPEDKEEYIEQLTLYALWIRQKYGKYCNKIKARLHYLHFDIVDEWEITDENLQPIVNKYIKYIDKIEASKNLYNINKDNCAFPIKQNNYCKYCEYQDICPLFGHSKFEDEVVNLWELWEKTIKSMIDQYAKLSEKVSKIKKEQDLLKEILVDYADKNSLCQLYWNSDSISITKTINYSAKDKDAFKSYLKRKWLMDKASDIPYYKINLLIEAWDISNDEIKYYLEWKTSWTLRAKKWKSENN